MRRDIRKFALGATLAIALAGCGGGGGETSSEEGGGSGGSTTVSVDDNLFDPESVEVAAGDTVTWEWTGSQPHNVRGDDFESDIQTEGTFEHTFEEPRRRPSAARRGRAARR